MIISPGALEEAVGQSAFPQCSAPERLTTFHIRRTENVGRPARLLASYNVALHYSKRKLKHMSSPAYCAAELLALKHRSRILGHSSNPVCGFYVMEQVIICAVWSMENWLNSFFNHIQGRTTVRESYRALEQASLLRSQMHNSWNPGQTVSVQAYPINRIRRCQKHNH